MAQPLWKVEHTGKGVMLVLEYEDNRTQYFNGGAPEEAAALGERVGYPVPADILAECAARKAQGK